MNKLLLPLIMLFAFHAAKGQTTISVSTGTPLLDGFLAENEWNSTAITTNLGVKLNAMTDEQYFYMSAQWSDATENIAKARWTYNGSTWVKSADEDRIAFFFDMGLNGTDGANCQTMCHMPVMSTNGGKADLWHWKAVRSNPMGYVDDNYIDNVNRQGDPGTSTVGDNVLSNGRPSFMSLNDPNANVDFITKDDAAYDAFDPFGVIAPHTYNKSSVFDTLASFNIGSSVPGYLLRLPTDDRASVMAAGKWVNGVWTVEFKKALEGTNNDFAVIPGSQVQFTYEIFDNEGSTHWTNGFDGTILTLDFSSIIPVELISFTAKIFENDIILNWQTATEINNHGFIIERKTPGREFTEIAFINGNGTTTQRNLYTYTDKDLDNGKYIYRLKQIDFDGQFKYSQTAEVNYITLDKYSLSQNYPNPLNPSTKIKYAIPFSSMVMINVYDDLGNEIETLVNEEKPSGIYEVNWNAAHLPSGIYFYRLKAGGFMETKKMILMK